MLAGDVGELRQAAPTRSVRVTFDADVSWAEHPDGWRHVGSEARTVAFQVPATLQPADVLAAASARGHVTAFEFVPPSLSEVFIETVRGAS